MKKIDRCGLFFSLKIEYLREKSFILWRFPLLKGPKQPFTVQSREVFIIRRSLHSKIRSGGPKSLFNEEVFTMERCSLTEVSLYILKRYNFQIHLSMARSTYHTGSLLAEMAIDKIFCRRHIERSDRKSNIMLAGSCIKPSNLQRIVQQWTNRDHGLARCPIWYHGPMQCYVKSFKKASRTLWDER